MVQRGDAIYQELCTIAATFGVFDCIPCARMLKQFLIEHNIPGVQIVLETGSQDPQYGRIYDDSIGELIATTGHHEGIVLQIDEQEIVFDNIHPDGVPKGIWLSNLYSPILEMGQPFQITEIEF